MTPPLATLAIWTTVVVATAGVIVRPFKVPEAVWAVLGAGSILAFGLLPWADGLKAVGEGLDVYLFLTGMMLLSETARREGVFDWVAQRTVNAARGSPKRLFLLVYGVGVLVTVFLSNDATAVVLTPAVFAAAKRAKVDALPYLLICAFIANAASFVLPISNPANLVLYSGRTPSLTSWLASFALPSALSILATYAALYGTQRHDLRARFERQTERAALSTGGVTALAGIGLTAIALLAVSAANGPLGLPTAGLGVLTTVVVLIRDRASPWPLLRGVSWSVLPLVAGLFVLVEALNQTGAVSALSQALRAAAAASEPAAAAGAGGLIAVVCNLVNNLPAGLIASQTVAQAHAPRGVIDALLIGVDLGPNFSVTGSLATILWLTAIRREGENVGFWTFLRIGAVVTPGALMLAIGARLLAG